MECPALGSFSEFSDEKILSEILSKVQDLEKVNLFIIVTEAGQPMNKDFYDQLKAYELAFGATFWESCAFVTTSFHVSSFSQKDQSSHKARLSTFLATLTSAKPGILYTAQKDAVKGLINDDKIPALEVSKMTGVVNAQWETQRKEVLAEVEEIMQNMATDDIRKAFIQEWKGSLFKIKNEEVA
jgi:hypothetical protein